MLNFRGPLIKLLLQQGHGVVVLAPEWPVAERLAVAALGAKVMDYPLARTGLNPIQDLRSLWHLWRALSSVRPDVCLSYMAKPVVWGTLAAWLAGVRRRVALIEGMGYVFTDTGQPPGIKIRLLRRLMLGLYRMALGRAHRVLVLNNDDLHELVALRALTAEAAVNIGGIGVDLSEWPQLPLPSGRTTFALAARLLREKGVLDYVAAARLIKQRHPAVRFLLLGGLDENPGALARIEVQQWVDDGLVEWPGHVPMREWLAQSSVYVLPSYREGMPRTIQEAMALGRPIITTQVPGCRDTVVEGVNGFLVPPRDPQALAAAMEQFILVPGLIAQMGAASRAMAEQRFDVHRINALILRELGIQ